MPKIYNEIDDKANSETHYETYAASKYEYQYSHSYHSGARSWRGAIHT